MKIENKIRVFAGLLIFITALLGFIHNHYWLFFTMFIGLNLFQFGFTNFCPLEKFLLKFERKE